MWGRIFYGLKRVYFSTIGVQNMGYPIWYIFILYFSTVYGHAGWLLAIGQQVGADGPNAVGRSIGCEDDQSCGPNRGQVDR